MDVVVVDNLDNGSVKALDAAAAITGRAVEFHRFDVADRTRLDEVFAGHEIDGVIHFARFDFQIRLYGYLYQPNPYENRRDVWLARDNNGR